MDLKKEIKKERGNQTISTEVRIRKPRRKRNLTREKNGRKLGSKVSGFSQQRHFICNNDKTSNGRHITSGKLDYRREV
jgi:hypothetical protein